MTINSGSLGGQAHNIAHRIADATHQVVDKKTVLNQSVHMINGTAGASASNNLLGVVSLDSLMLAIMSDRAELLEDTLREQVQEVRKKNSKLKGANAIMAKARAAKKGSTEDDSTIMPKEVVQFFADNRIPWGENGSQIDTNVEHKLKSTEWDLAIENLKGWSESLTSTSQLDMTKLQSTSGKFNQTFEMMSQFISKYFRSGDSVIRNI